MDKVDCAVIGAMEAEVEGLRARLDRRLESRLGPIICWEGWLEGKRLVLAQSGIGKVQAAITTVLILNAYQPDFIINTGSAGGLAAELSFGDIIISERVFYHDVDVTGFGYAYGQIPGQAAAFKADPALIDRAFLAATALKAEGRLPKQLVLSRGSIASGDVFVKDDDHRQAILQRFPGLQAVEMEGAAIAHTCSLYQVPFIVIRAVSDVAGKESPMNFREFLPLAAERSSLLVQRIIQEV